MVDEDFEFKLNDAGSYDSLAAEFDRFTQRVTRYAVDPILDAAHAREADHLVDIGCGTGIVTLAAAQLPTRGDARVTGIDLSKGMLDFARELAKQSTLTRHATFLEADAEALPLDDNSASAITSLYAFRHFPNPESAAAECLRVLAPGGWIAIGVGSGPALLSLDGLKAACARLPRLWANHVGRERTACGQIDALVERYLPSSEERSISGWSESNQGFSGPLTDLLRNAGFVDLKTSWRGREFVFDDPEEFWDLQTTFSSIARKRIAAAEASDVTRLKDAFRSDCEAVQKKGGRLVYRVGTAIIAARKT